MRINNVRSGVYSDLPVPSTRGEPSEATGPGLLSSLASVQELATPAGSALRGILAEYDVTDITPRQFSEMLQKMYKSGAISEDELADLNLIRADLERDLIDPDESVDLVEYYANKLQKQPLGFEALNLSDDEPSPEILKRRLAWLEKLALIQSSPEPFGLDAVA